MSCGDEDLVDAPAFETAAEETGIIILIIPVEGMTLLRRSVFSGFKTTFDPHFTMSILRERVRLTPPEPLRGGEVNSAFQLDVDTADG